MKFILRSILVFLLTLEASLVLRKYKPKIVVVTGSVGKTSTKDAVYTALQLRYRVRKSDKSFNSDFGVPLTILGCPNGWYSPRQWITNLLEGLALIFLSQPNYPEWLVLEVGADKPGDVRSILRYVKPTIVVLTRLPDVPVHVEFYKSPKDVIEEEGMPVHHLTGEGILVTNADDANISPFIESTRAKVLTVGVHHAADVVFSNELTVEEKGKPAGIAFTITHQGAAVPFAVSGVLGRQHVYPIALAVAVGLSQGINLVDLSDSFQKHQTPPGRMRILPGIKGTTLIDDTYNASPVAVEEALRALREISVSGRRIGVLGDMLELGTYSKEMHEKIGKLAGGFLDVLATVGVRSRGTASAALGEGMSEKFILQYEDSTKAGRELQDMIEEGDVLLIKGSQSMRMERITKELMAEPERAEALLCRQEEIWLSKK
jgi:UDP-N-acetylmuramoyl-tripeptide--D-alanyl-D-alanine ligase